MKKTNLLHLSTIVLVASILLGACSSVKESNAPTETVAPTKTYPAPTNTQTIAPTISPVATTPSPLVQATSTLDKAHYISETYPDGSNAAPGASFDKTWRLQNTGTTTWTTNYTLTYISSSPTDEKLGSPDTIHLSKVVNPGESIDITVKLTAPKATGSYKVTWRLLNPQGQIVSVDGYDLWALINVGNAQVSSPVTNTSGGSVLQSVTASGITVNLIEVTYGEQSSNIKYCITLPDDTNWFPQDMWVNVNGQTTSVGFVLAGSKHDPSTFAAYRCYITTTESDIKTSESFSFSIGLIGRDGTLAEDCPSAKQSLATQYPDLIFECRPIDGGAFYTFVQKPKNISDQEADSIIMDAIQKNIYGLWSFNITR